MSKFGWLAPLRPSQPANAGDGKPADSALRTALFGRRENDADSGARAIAKRYALTSMIGEGMVIAGPVSVRDSLMVFGRVFGGITVTGEHSILMLREGSGVKGDVKAPTILIKGKVIGRIEGKMVRLYPGSHVCGSIHAGQLIVDDGATIETPSVQANITTPSGPAIHGTADVGTSSAASHERGNGKA